MNEITRFARVVKLGAVGWKGDRKLPVTEQGSPEHVQEFRREQEIVFQRIPWVNDPQAVWLIPLMCGSTRADFWLRAVAPEFTAEFAGHHDAKVWGCLCKILGVPSGSAEAQVGSKFGVVCRRIGPHQRQAAHWASWADYLRMVRQRHPDVEKLMIHPHPTWCCSMFQVHPGMRKVACRGRFADASVVGTVRIPPLSWRSTQNPTSRRWVGSDKL